MADIKISALTAASALTGAEIVPVVQSAANRRTTAQDIANLAAAGALTLISTLTASGSASLPWTGLTADNHLLVINALVPATNGADILLQFGEGGTPTWKTANYDTISEYLVLNSGAGNGVTWTGAGAGFLIANAVDNASPGLRGGMVELFNLSQTETHGMQFNCSRVNSSTIALLRGVGSYTGDTAAITAVRLIASSGNLASGSASLYKLSKT